jgi:hypothetical protein
MADSDYKALMEIVRGYRTAEVLRLMDYRNRRTHRVSPAVDHPELSVDVVEPGMVAFSRTRSISPAEYSFLKLYADAKIVYAQITKMLLRANAIVHA